MTNIRHTLFGMTFLLIAWVNLVTIVNPVLGALAALGFLWSLSMLLGSRFANDRSMLETFIIGLLCGLSLLMLGGSAIYYFGSVTTLSLSLLLVAVLAISSIASKKTTATPCCPPAHSTGSGHPEEFEGWEGGRTATAAIIVLLALAAWWSHILPIEVIDAIRSPWDAVDPRILIAIAIATLVLITMIGRSVSKLTTTLLILLFASSLTIAVLIYTNGYGFDPFIHRATIEHIAEHGTITPKPMYYIGQYALELIGALIFALPIKLIDSLLVPLAAAFLIPLSAAAAIRTLGSNWRMMLIALFLLPLGAFISTTPQSLAYILTACLVLTSLPLLMNKIESKPYLGFLAILTLAILITHPLAGIPAAFYFVLVFISRINATRAIRVTLTSIITILGALALPLIFVWQSRASNLDIQFSLTNLSWDQLNLTGFLNNQFSSWFDLLYLVIDNHLWIVLILAIIGVIFARIEKLPHGLCSGLYAAIASLVSYLILTLALQFEFLIEYERTNYADRLLTMAIIFLIPYVSIALSEIWARLKEKPASLRLAYVLIATIVSTGMIYGAYPRHDNYARSAGFNVAQADFDAVYAIEEYADNVDYIVLANQATSSAALEAYGFAHYYHGDIFYYPIPTGGAMYNYFLEMTDEEPTAEVMNQAMDYAGVELGFFVVSEYWWESDTIIEHAKNEAIDWFALGDGAVTVFVFEKE